MKKLKAPFPWFGGKSRVAHLVWERFGDVGNYVEPFAGSLAVLLARPTPARVETVNDLDCYLANFWRATQAAPEEVARWSDAPVNEADLHARHRWLHKQAEPALSPGEAEALEAFRAAHPALASRVLHDPARWGFREKMRNDPAFFDAQLAGWWVWGLSCWIGDNWCRPTEQNSAPHLVTPAKGCNATERIGGGNRANNFRVSAAAGVACMPQGGFFGDAQPAAQLPSVARGGARGVAAVWGLL